MNARERWRLNLFPESVSVVAAVARRRHNHQRLELEYDQADHGSYQHRVLPDHLRPSRWRSDRIGTQRSRTQVAARYPVYSARQGRNCGETMVTQGLAHGGRNGRTRGRGWLPDHDPSRRTSSVVLSVAISHP